MDSDIMVDPFESSQAAVAERLAQILDAATTKDVERLAGYHLNGPKFSKFDDAEPLERQDAALSARMEAEQFASMENFHGRFDDLKIDVFGPVAVATGVFVWDCRVQGRPFSGRTRSTVVLAARDGEEWLIVHEHHSPFVASS